MSVDENEFFRQVTRLICGSLDIEKALNRCHQYIGKFIPVFRMYFVEVEPDLSLMRVVAQSSLLRDKVVKRSVCLSEKAKVRYKEELAGQQKVIIVNDPESHPIAMDSLSLIENGNTNASFLALFLEIEGQRLTELIMQADGKDRYTQSHARLLSLLHDPFAIAISNALRYQELLKLKEIQSDQIQYLHQELLRSSGDEIRVS